MSGRIDKRKYYYDYGPSEVGWFNNPWVIGTRRTGPDEFTTEIDIPMPDLQSLITIRSSKKDASRVNAIATGIVGECACATPSPNPIPYLREAGLKINYTYLDERRHLVQFSG